MATLARTKLISKLVVGLLALSLLSLLGSVAVGFASNEPIGHLSFGLLFACAAVVVAVAIALKSPVVTFRLARGGWLTMAALTLLIAIVLTQQGGDLLLTLALFTLAFPASVPIAPIVGSLLGDATQRPAGLFLLWLTLVTTGYVQWFIVCVHLFRNCDRNNATDVRS